MKVSDVMVTNPVMVAMNAPCGRLALLMRDKGIDSVIVVDAGKPVGIVTERDLVHRIMAENKNPDSCSANDVSSKPVVAITVHADVDLAVDMMNEYKIRRLVVVDDSDTVVGILTTDDLARNLREMSEELAVKYTILSRRDG
ncbi:MAG: CBS domain-containing protein [Candidatus Bathyarchaeota archaeon]|nr:CBS domain-containing protein [Candidatus Bathyarchaeota archaeon]